MLHTRYQRAVAGALFTIGLLSLPMSAQAAGYCNLGTATEGISTSNMTFNTIAASDCYGVAGGNINSGDAAAVDALAWGDGWAYLDTTDANGATFMGLDFTLTESGTSSGTWTLTGVDSNGTADLNFPVALDFAVGLKGGNEYALWSFDNAVVTSSNSGTFSIVFTNKGGNVPDLSHMIVFGREAGGGIANSIPEADTYAMLLAGLGLVGFAARRKLN